MQVIYIYLTEVLLLSIIKLLKFFYLIVKVENTRSAPTPKYW